MNQTAELTLFGENLRKIRESKGYTQQDLAEISGISRRIIGHYETQVKRPTLEKIQILADALKVPISSILGEEQTAVTKDASYKIMKKVRIIEKMPKRDQDTIFSLINALAKKNDLL